MMPPGAFDVKILREMAMESSRRVEERKKEQAAYWRWEKRVRPPVVLPGDLRPEQEKIPQPNFKEAFYDSFSMLCAQMRPAFEAINSPGGAVPSIRANMGVGVLLSLFGGGQLVFEDKMPWPKTHFSKEELSNIKTSDMQIIGDFDLGLKHMRYFKETMGDYVPIYCMDHQGPFDLAHLLLGDSIFTEIFDDPDFVHHLLGLCVEVSTDAILMMKRISGEARTECHHSNFLYSDALGIRICEDTSALLGPEQIAEFVVPYTTELAKNFGGAWVHYCGRNDHLTEQISAIPEVKGLNFGLIPGKEHDHVFEEDMEKCLSSRTIYTGRWPRRPGEKPSDYVKRLRFWADQGCLIAQVAREDIDCGAREFFDMWCSAF